MITGLVVALPEEINTLTAKKIAKGECCFITDKLLVAYSGAGSNNARATAKRALALGATQLISWGCAAGLSDKAKPGDLILAMSLLDAEYRRNEAFTVTGAWQSHCKKLLENTLTVHTGPLLESSNIVSKSSEKKQLFKQTGAIALDMETIAVATVAKQNAIPFIVIRAIADPVSMNLPDAISHALNAQGDVELIKLLQFLMLHPWELPGLIKLGLHFNAAIKTLKTVAAMLDTITAFDPIDPATLE
ncbi:MAG: phosphorylase [Methylococcales bacterium]